MALRKLLSRGLPEVPTEAPGARGLIEQVLESPPFIPVRLFWDNLYALRDWWPVLLPLLAWIGWRTYRSEREAVLNRTG